MKIRLPFDVHALLISAEDVIHSQFPSLVPRWGWGLLLRHQMHQFHILRWTFSNTYLENPTNSGHEPRLLLLCALPPKIGIRSTVTHFVCSFLLTLCALLSVIQSVRLSTHRYFMLIIMLAHSIIHKDNCFLLAYEISPVLYQLYLLEMYSCSLLLPMLNVQRSLYSI